jgi:uncharacterized SAM-binding protein YcdF (DUF218 family)
MSNDQTSPPSPPAKCCKLNRLGEGLILGAAFAMAMNFLFINEVLPVGGYQIPIYAACGAGIALTSARRLLWYINGAILILIAVIAYTPVMKPLIRGVERDDPPGHAPAVVVLSNYVFKDWTLNSSNEDRAIHGLEILREGEANTLVLTRPVPPSLWPGLGVRAEMKALGFDFPVEEVGPVSNTHDEALAVAALAKERRWDKVILVTDPWHMRRAAAVFEKAGVKVICAPCAERSYDVNTMDGPGDRLHAFGDWLHEAVGYEYYRLRGWI